MFCESCKMQDEEYSAKLKKSNERTLALIKSAMDIVVAAGLLQLSPQKITPRVTGAFGFTTSIISCYQVNTHYSSSFSITNSLSMFVTFLFLIIYDSCFIQHHSCFRHAPRSKQLEANRRSSFGKKIISESLCWSFWVICCCHKHKYYLSAGMMIIITTFYASFSWCTSINN